MSATSRVYIRHHSLLRFGLIFSQDNLWHFIQKLFRNTVIVIRIGNANHARPRLSHIAASIYSFVYAFKVYLAASRQVVSQSVTDYSQASLPEPCSRITLRQWCSLLLDDAV